MAKQPVRNSNSILRFLDENFGLDTVLPNDTSVPKGFLLYLIVQEKKFSTTATCRRLSQHIGYEVDNNLTKGILCKLKKILDDVKKHISSDTEWKKFTTILQEIHKIIPKRSVVPPRATIVPIPSPSDPPIAMVTRQDCERCVTKQKKLEFSILETLKVRDELKAAKEEIKNVKLQVKGLNEILKQKDALDKQTAEDSRKTKQALKRKINIEKKLRIENTSLKQQVRLRKGIMKDPLLPNRQLRGERIRMWHKNDKIKKTELAGIAKDVEIVRLTEELKRQKAVVDDLECQLMTDDFQESFDDAESVSDYVVPEKFQRDIKSRKFIYQCLLSRVPLRHVGDLVKFTTGDSASTTVSPSCSTISRMSTELTAITYLQATSVLLASEGKGSCIGWDATTMGDRHVNEVHIITPDKKALLSPLQLYQLLITTLMLPI